MRIKIDGPHFKDEAGRILMLRGVNLGGSTKVPAKPYLPSHIKEGFYSKNVSFVNKPFPLKDADEHFSRLKHWGLTFVRFLVTWEAIEHEAPGKYDEKYLNYVYEVIKKAQEYDIQVFIDPHQDVWSRFSGGDGAPLWTFEKIGLNVQQFSDAEAAILHHEEGDFFPEMIWPTNYTKLACATMFTLFFGGNDFAPQLQVDGQPIQEFLQSHYINSIKQVAERVKDLDNVVGYDTMNEPSAGWIGWKDLHANEFVIRKGATPSPFQSMVLASGNPQQVENWDLSNRGPKFKGKMEANPRGVKAWLNGFGCIWKAAGVWDMNQSGLPELLKPDHFSKVKGKEVNFEQDYLLPFINRYAREIRSVHPNTFIFVEGVINGKPPQFGSDDAQNVVNASHWYDGITLFTKKFRSWISFDFQNQKMIFGKKAVRRLFARQIARLKEESEAHMRNAPLLVGETGIPFDMHRKKAYETGNFSKQIKALNATLRAIEDNLTNVTLWNYTADNSNEYGDLWNKEDLSVFSRDQQTNPEDINSGGRALEALIRPYPIRTSGNPLRLSFDIKKQIFEYEFEHDEHLKVPTEIFIPQYQYPKGCKVSITDGNYELDAEKQLLTYHHSVDRYRHVIRVTKMT